MKATIISIYKKGNTILQNHPEYKITVQRAEDILDMSKEDLRTLFKENNGMFIYHDIIDKTGHDGASVFKAAEDALDELMRLIKKLAGANAYNFIITADHGFIYQNHALHDSDFLGEKAQGDILINDVRFVVGRNLEENNRFKKFKSADVGLSCSYEFQFPKSINRLRKQGSDGCYVHGGLSLQEIIIPVIQVNKKRESDTSYVDVEILKNGNIISSNQIAVKLYQVEKIDVKLQSRTLRLGIYNKDNEPISDRQEITFDFTSDNPRDREMIANIILTKKVDNANGQEVKLKLEEKIQGTNQYKEYKSTTYTVRKTFTTDFDF